MRRAGVTRCGCCLQISYASSTHVLSNGDLYPTVFRTVPSSGDLPQALTSFLELFGWQQVAVFTQELAAPSEVRHASEAGRAALCLLPNAMLLMHKCIGCQRYIFWERNYCRCQTDSFARFQQTAASNNVAGKLSSGWPIHLHVYIPKDTHA